MLCARRAQLGAKLPPDGARLRHVGPELDLHVHSVASIWVALGPASKISTVNFSEHIFFSSAETVQL